MTTQELGAQPEVNTVEDLGKDLARRNRAVPSGGATVPMGYHTLRVVIVKTAGTGSNSFDLDYIETTFDGTATLCDPCLAAETDMTDEPLVGSTFGGECAFIASEVEFVVGTVGDGEGAAGDARGRQDGHGRNGSSGPPTGRWRRDRSHQRERRCIPPPQRR